VIVPLQWRLGEELAQGAGGRTGGIGELGHRGGLPVRAVGRKVQWCTLDASGTK
jgi:hypothetical protein